MTPAPGSTDGLRAGQASVSTLVLVPEYSGVSILGRSAIRVRILAMLVDISGERLHLREIARRAGTSAGTTARELRRLEDAGLVVREPEGRQVYFSAGESSVYPPIHGLRPAMVQEAATPLALSPNPDPLGLAMARRLRRDLQAVYGRRLVDVYLFGSRARGDNDPESDVDVLVVLDDIHSYAADLRLSGEVTAELALEAGVTISRLLATSDAWDHRDRPILRVIAIEGIRT